MANQFFGGSGLPGNRIVSNAGSFMMGSNGRMVGSPWVSGTPSPMRDSTMSGYIAGVGQRAMGGTTGERMRLAMSAGS